MSSIFDWSLNSANNANADSAINWAEGQNPSTVNNSARVMMQRIKEMLNDLNGVPLATGTSNGITITLSSPITAYADGMRGSFKAASDNSSNVTINVNSIGAKPALKFTASGETQLLPGEIKAGCIYEVLYVSSLNSAAGGWLVLNPTQQNTPVGTIITVASGQTPSGYLPLAGGVYSRTAFPALWAHAAASGNITSSDAEWGSSQRYGSYSPGDGSTNFRVPDPRGFFVRVFDGGRGVDSGRGMGTYQGSQNLSHSHGVNDPGHSHNWGNTARGFGINTTPGNFGIFAQGGSSPGDLNTTGSGTGISIQGSGGNESRPQSIAWPMYVKY
ncbi:phage tail protein [Rhizobium sp. CNPSo 4062]|uniref:phage tail protein n=1 Tax=Rhizobium sp. CNPSo 4062 TaxID=3021410 RepID=UPI0025508449|nr:phage tail protein [Rhizobium sp. CNPSo 4062]MDK4703905.1 phage tail protein [Rhizobium sp. CNPSo 4062]